MIPEIVELRFHRYNKYNSLLTVYYYSYYDANGNYGDALTDSFVPINSTDEEIIREHIMPYRNWQEVIYKAIIYYLTPPPPPPPLQDGIGKPIVVIIGLVVSMFFISKLRGK